MSWSLFYLYNSFQSILPWSTCNNSWNTPLCWNAADINVTRPNGSVSPSLEFYERRMLKQSSGIEEQGSLRGELCMMLFISWLLVFLCVCKGIKSSGKVVYFTATFPYVVIVVLMIKGLMLPGSSEGVGFFILPEWDLLKQPKVWVNAASQNFNSIGIAFGSMITFSSYNKPSNPIFKKILVITLLNACTSILSGFAIFSSLGNIAYNQGVKVTDVVAEGPGLVFIVYPEVFSGMPVPAAQIFAVLFFFMLLCMGIDSQFAGVEVVVTSLRDHLPGSLLRIFSHKTMLVAFVCIVCFFLGFPNITEGGIYFFQLINMYSSGISLMLIAFFEAIAICWFYGARQLSEDIGSLTGSLPSKVIVACWYTLSPLLIMAIMIFSWIAWEPITYGSYTYPLWAEICIGWGLACMSLVCLPIGMIFAYCKADGHSCMSRLLSTFSPSQNSSPQLRGCNLISTTKQQDELTLNSDTSL